MSYSQGQQIVDNLQVIARFSGERLTYATVFVPGEKEGEAKESRHVLFAGPVVEGEPVTPLVVTDRLRDLAADVNSRMVKAVQGGGSKAADMPESVQ